MSGYQINQSIPLTFSRISDGVRVTGLSVTVTVYDDNTNSVLLASTALTETSGIYRYTWSGVTSFKNCRATYQESGKFWDEYFTIEDEDDIVEGRSGRAT